MNMILPKGFVINTDDTYAEVASYPLVPPDKIYGYWRVYTTTHRKLIDPTARRLENFWWHVWGSDRRELSGKKLAKLFEDISTGPTFVTLRGPPNRYDGPPIPRFSHNELDGRQPGPPPPEAASPGQSKKSSTDEDPTKDRTSSSSKPPPKHSILKKPRGPSNSGPRPTARFVSPPGSDGEEAKDDGTSSGSITTNGVEIKQQPPASLTKPEKRSTPVTTKKFVASTSASKRRPLLSRRPSSQSSTASDVGSRDGNSVSSTRSAGSQRSMTTVEEQPTPRGSVPRSQGSGESSSSQNEKSALSAKAAGKRRARLPPMERESALRGTWSQADGQARPVVVQTQPVAQHTGRVGELRAGIPEYEVNRPRNEGVRGTGQRSAFEQALSAARAAATPPMMAPPLMARSHSNTESRARETSAGRLPSQGLISSSIAATSKVAVQGTFDFEDPTAMASPPEEARDIPDEISLASRLSATSLRDMRFMPTQPSPTPPVPLGRSKSQLTLLLEREKEKLGGDRHKGRDKDRDGKSYDEEGGGRRS